MNVRRKSLQLYGELDTKLRDDIKHSFRGRIIIHSCISGIVACIIEFFLITNITVIDKFLKQLGYSGTLFRTTIQHSNTIYNSTDNIKNALTQPVAVNVTGLVLFVTLVGICVFVLCFALLQRHQIKYMEEISCAMKDISGGDLNRTVEVKGDDELSDIALELNKMAEDIKDLMEREREAEKTKNELITNVAHDLRTPLTSILGYLDLLSNNNKLTSETREKYLVIAFQKARHLQNLIEDLFGFTKMSHGTISIQVAPIDIVKLLEQLLDEFYPAFVDNHLEYHYETNTNSLILNADGTLLARLFDNLINNAIKYGKDGKIVNVKLFMAESHVIIQVVNYGFVIPDKELALIFNKFYRVEQSRSSNTGGTGLGLAIAKNIVDLHGGTIEARSSLKGTVFEVKLPLHYNYEQEGFGTAN